MPDQKVPSVQITVNQELCIHCGHCVRVCPSSVLRQEDGAGQVSAPDQSACIRCGHCVDVCPKDALRHSAFPPERIHYVNTDLLPSPESLLELMRSRRSNRTITDCPVPDDCMEMILEAARYAPTAENSRRVGLHVVADPDALQQVESAAMTFFMRLARILLCPPVKFLLRPFLKDLYREAPGLLAMNEAFRRGERPATCQASALLLITAPRNYAFGYQDCNLAYQNASLMAESLGVTQIYMGFVQTAFQMMGVRRTARLLGLPSHQRVYAIMALGIPAFRFRKYVERC
ncbi:MAG: nitroreductase family protein [Bacteroidaceae bacterium]|nr:nitroreductase family protein [Bacteroidaceae bacterium]